MHVLPVRVDRWLISGLEEPTVSPREPVQPGPLLTEHFIHGPRDILGEQRSVEASTALAENVESTVGEHTSRELELGRLRHEECDGGIEKFAFRAVIIQEVHDVLS